VVIDGLVTHQAQWSDPLPAGVVDSRLLGRDAGPVVETSPGGHITLRNTGLSIRALLRGCEGLPIRAVKAVGDTSGPAGTMQHGTLCMLVVYARRITYGHPGGPASLFTSLPVTGAAAAEGMALPAEPWAAGGSGHGLLLTSNAAQQVEPQPVPQGMGTAIEQAAGEAGAGCEGTPPLNSPAPALTFSPLPAPAAPAVECLGLDFTAPSSAHHQCVVTRDDLQLPAPPLPGGPATAQLQPHVRGLNGDGNTSELAQAGLSEVCIPQSTVQPAVPDVMSAELSPAGDECQLPADFAESYGITSTKVFTTCQAPAWWVPGPLLVACGAQQA
jgi:hypothetical protein